MKAIDLCILLTGYTLVVAFASLWELMWHRRRRALVLVVVALGGVVATAVAGAYLKPGTSYGTLVRQLVAQRDSSAVVALVIGVSAATVWLGLLMDRSGAERQGAKEPNRRRHRYALAGQVLVAAMLPASVVGVVGGTQAFIWKDLSGFQRDPPVRVHSDKFVIEKVADLNFMPIRVAASADGKAYVCYDYFERWGTIGGAIVELQRDEATGTFRQKIVADSTLLMRSYGLVARNGELFVSRSGVAARASKGSVTYEATGAVTRLQDLNDDGYYEFADDIVTGLPGARGPDTMQQNNGICFTDDGTLFVTVSSAGNRTLDPHPWSGCVLRVNADFSQTEVFARGFRNPFGIAIGPDNEVFLTDNDVDENPGDELNHVALGEHYGHPFVVPHESGVVSEGFRGPIHVGELESNYLGLVYATSAALPAEFRDCFYMADFMQNAIWQVRVARDVDTYKVTDVIRFATVTTPVDIAVTPEGEFFVISRNTQNVYSIRPTTAVVRGTR
ncbi:MAG: PQQ-dependent sugar dehydrogenase [Pirellulaceae bacterium]|nr:PQQ-dependent sugar dehydrogenase [Planctomycetales bacterium]